jgi:hypothetical protein
MGASYLEAEEMLARLVAAPSPNPPGDEWAVANVVTEEICALGLPVPERLGRGQT